MRRVHVVVDGMVQGVGYRWALRMEADRAGVTGWARNRADGTVEAELEGDPSAVESVLAWMSRGPRGAAVSSVTPTDIAPAGSSRFDIRP